MSPVYKFRNAGGFGAFTRYNDFLAGNPTFFPGSFDSIATATGNGSASSFTFSSLPSGYAHYQIRLIARGVRSFAAEQLYLRFNGDGGNNYTYHYMIGTGSGVGASATTNVNVILVNEIPAANETANIYSTSIIDILDVNSTNKNKVVRTLNGYDNNGNTSNYFGTVWVGSGVWLNTAAISSITVLSNGAFATSTSVALYGIKGAA